MVAFFNIVDSESEHESEAEEAPVEEPQSKRTKKANERKKLNESQVRLKHECFLNEKLTKIFSCFTGFGRTRSICQRIQFNV